MTEPKRIHLSDYQPPQVHIDKTELHFRLDDHHTEVKSCLQIRKSETFQSPLVLNAEGLNALVLEVDGRTLGEDEFSYEHDLITLKCELPDAFEFKTSCEIDPAGNLKLEGLYKSGAVFCTQMESEGFRRVTPYLDRPDVLSRFTTRIEAKADAFPQLLSNGNLVERGDMDHGYHFAKWEDPTLKPCYLFALVAGDLGLIRQPFTTMSGREVMCEVYVDKGNENRAQHALSSLLKAMKWDEDVFGLEYDLDLYMIVAVDAFNFGAMENKGLNVFNSSAVLADPETATDMDYQRIEGIVAHEYFHNWTGNRVTCRDWFQLTLKEGLTVFRDQEFSSDMHLRDVFRIQEVSNLRERQFLEDSGPNAHPIKPSSYMEINNFYTATIYEKGAEVIRMIHTLTGPEGFRKGMDLYFERHDGQAVCTEHFVAAMADANNLDLADFEGAWYHQAGTPRLLHKGVYDATAQTFTLDLEQVLPDEAGEGAAPYHIPVRLALLDGAGGNLPLVMNGESLGEETIVELKANQGQFVFEQVKIDPKPSLLRQFSAPVVLESSESFEQSLVKWAVETDDFNRFEVGQELAHHQIAALLTREQLDARYLQVFRQVLLSSMVHGTKAEVLTLPSLSQMLERCAHYRPVRVDECRRKLKRDLSDFCKEEFTDIYNRLWRHDDLAISTLDMGRRSLKNVCLSYLCASGETEAFERASAQYRGAANMTDRMAALVELVNAPVELRDPAVNDFAQRFGDNTVVMNKWFMVQAGSHRDDLLDHLIHLESHPVYDDKNPNKIRALLGGLIRNLVAFHAEDGEGYAFLAKRIAIIDSFNSGVAANLARAFAKYPSLEGAMADKMEVQLKQLLCRPGLSRDVYEIVSNTLSSRASKA